MSDGGKSAATGTGSGQNDGRNSGQNAGKADATAWLSVAAGTLGALMATLDISIVNAALPTIQGEIGASGTEGTWISTAYLVAEIVMIPMAGWLQKALGLRTLLLIMTTLFIVSSMFCGISETLPEMVVGRIGQGFSGGALIPTALTIVATRLPPAQQPIGTALFGVTAIFGPVAGPVVGGYLTENLSWHYAFFINVPIGVALLVLLLVGLPQDERNLGEFRDTDWLGILGLILGLGGLTTTLEEGERNNWFQSNLIRGLALVSFVGFVFLLAGQWLARKPVIRLRLLVDRVFGGVFVMSLVVGAALYGVLYLIPQYLVGIAGYNAEQSGFIAAINGGPTMLMMVTFPFLVKRLDVRLAVALGLFLYAMSCFLDSNLSPVSAGPQFVPGQLLRGFGVFFSMIFLNQAAARSVEVKYARDASGLFNAARNLGGSLGLAWIATMQDRRTTLHFTRLTESLPANLPRVQAAAHHLGVQRLYQDLMQQASVLAYGDLYWMFGVLLLTAIPLVVLMKPLPNDGSPVEGKK